MATQPMEPMDTYMCVLMKLRLINTSTTYTQHHICSIISDNQAEFDSIYDNPAQRTLAVAEYMDDVQTIDIIDKNSDCG